MRPLTEHTPKPLLCVGGDPLIVWHLYKLKAAGIEHVIINTSWLADAFPKMLGDGKAFGLHIDYLYEGPRPLETGGGMQNACAYLGAEPFIVVNGDIWTDYDFTCLPGIGSVVAHLVLVSPPPHAPQGDFYLNEEGYLSATGGQCLTYAGIGVFRPECVLHERVALDTLSSASVRPYRLAPVLHAHVQKGRITGEKYNGRWCDVGTPERLHELDSQLRYEGCRAGDACF